MTLLIAYMLIAGLDLHGGLYVLATGVWLIRLGLIMARG